MRMPQPKVIQKWPGKPNEHQNKTPTTVLYELPNTQRPSWGGWFYGAGSTRPEGQEPKILWGFQCQYSEGKKEWFKRRLDPEFGRVEEDSDVRTWFKDYMSCLYAHLRETLQGHTGNWGQKRVIFTFSVPCTFKKASTIENFRNLLHEAGFCKGGAQHTIEIGITEPEAAAVYTAKEAGLAFESGNVMLVCDAGGGTTDVAILENVGINGGQPALEELAVVEGENIGSTNIDLAFKSLVEERLNSVLPKLDERTAWTMMHSADWVNWKCSFGHKDIELLNSFNIKVPLVGSNFNNNAAKIKDGKMVFSQQDFQALFDPEVKRIEVLISNQIRVLTSMRANKKIDYLMLSGGLGSSDYVRERLSAVPNFKNIQLLVSDEPQLAVARGLVIDTIAKLKEGRAVLRSRVCRASYGINMSTLYDKKNKAHVGQEVHKGFDGKLHVYNQILWMIHKGDKIDSNSPFQAHDFHCTFLIGNKQVWSSDFYMSFNDRAQLPTNTAHADAIHVCTVKANLSKLDIGEFEHVKYHFSKISGNGKTSHYRADYEIKLVIGAADLRFELWFGGVQYMEDNALTINFD